MQVPRKSKRLRPSVKIAIGAAVAIGVLFGGWNLYSDQKVKDYQMGEIAPGRINLVAVRPGTGWRIIVTNSIAQLAEVTGMDRGGDEDVQNGKKLPMREYIDSLRGNGDSLGYLIEKLADIQDETIPLGAPHWKVDDVEKAISGDPVLKQKLERDIQCRLDGSPNSELSVSSLINGIVIEVPVSVTIKIDGKPQTVTGFVRSTYTSNLAERVAKMITAKVNPKDEFVVGIYRSEGMKVLSGEMNREDVVASLRSRYHKTRISSLASKPQFLLDNSTVLVSDVHLEGASVDKYRAGNKQLANVKLNLTEEGKMRLWKYSHDHPGFQLLMVVDGLAYAAPRISTTLAERNVEITGFTEPDLAQEAVDRINEIEKERNG